MITILVSIFSQTPRMFQLLLVILSLAGSAVAADNKLSNSQKISLDLNERAVTQVKKGDNASAISLFKQALEQDEYNLSAVYNLAGLYLAGKQDKEAITLLERYAAATKTDPALTARFGDAYFSSKNIPAALSSYKNALALDPRFPGVAAKIATLEILQNNLSEAEKYLDLALKSDADNSQLLANMASVKLGVGKSNESIAYAKRAIQLQAVSAPYITLGAAYEQQEDFKNALISYGRARDLGDKSPELIKRISELEQAH